MLLIKGAHISTFICRTTGQEAMIILTMKRRMRCTSKVGSYHKVLSVTQLREQEAAQLVPMQLSADLMKVNTDTERGWEIKFSELV